MRRPVVKLTELPEHVALVGIEPHEEATLAELTDRTQVLQPGAGVAEGDERRRIGRQPDALGERPPHLPLRAVALLQRVRHGVADPARR